MLEDEYEAAGYNKVHQFGKQGRYREPGLLPEDCIQRHVNSLLTGGIEPNYSMGCVRAFLELLEGHDEQRGRHPDSQSVAKTG